MRFSSGSLEVEGRRACPWICWNKESLTRTASSSEKPPWVVLEKELETSLSLLNSTTALMDQHQLNHQFCGQSQHTQHIQQKKAKKEEAFSGLHLYRYILHTNIIKKNHIHSTLRHIFLLEKSVFLGHTTHNSCKLKLKCRFLRPKWYKLNLYILIIEFLNFFTLKWNIALQIVLICIEMFWTVLNTSELYWNIFKFKCIEYIERFWNVLHEMYLKCKLSLQCCKKWDFLSVFQTL